MKTRSMLLVMAAMSLGTLTLHPRAVAATSAAKGKAKAAGPKMAVCPVCAVKEGKKVPEPVKAQPLDRPFAFALVTLDGADAPLLHALDVASPDDVRTGMRVRVRWAAERTGAITDIACFEPYEGEDEADEEHQSAAHTGEFENMVTGIVAPARLD